MKNFIVLKKQKRRNKMKTNRNRMNSLYYRSYYKDIQRISQKNKNENFRPKSESRRL